MVDGALFDLMTKVGRTYHTKTVYYDWKNSSL